MSLLIRVIVVLAGVSGCLCASAACTQSNLTGTWYASAIAVAAYDKKHNDASGTNYCKLVINSKGVIDKKKSLCQTSLGQGYAAGTMRVSSTCQIKPFKLAAYNAKTGQLLNTQTVDYGMLDKGKTFFHVTGNKGSATTGLPQFLWTGAKQ